MKKNLMIYIGLILLILTLIIYINNFHNPKYKYEQIDGLLAFDKDNIEVNIKHSTNVFVGKIISQNDTYELDFGLPITSYTVEVVSNMKGKLKKGSQIDIFKEGGKLKSEKTIMFHENDGYLTIGAYYILLGNKQADDTDEIYKGSVFLNGAEDNIELDASYIDDLPKSEVFMRYITPILEEKYDL